MLPWQQLLPDTSKNLISAKFSWSKHKNLVKIHAGVKAVEHPETLRPEILKVLPWQQLLLDTPKNLS